MMTPTFTHWKFLPALFLFNALLAASAQAGVYKWVDDNGQIHYGERPPTADANAEKMVIRTNETTTPRKINTGDDKEGEDTKKQPATTEAQPEKPKISRQERNRLCKEATGDLAKILSRGRMRVKQKDGSYTYVSDQERQKRIRAAEKKKRENCR